MLNRADDSPYLLARNRALITYLQVPLASSMKLQPSSQTLRILISTSITFPNSPPKLESQYEAR